MPLQDHMKIVSVDDHVIEHPRVWSDRLPQRYLGSAPRIEETDKGHHVWVYEGTVFPYIGLNAVAGKTPEEFGMEPVRYEDMIPGCYEPDARVKDMDIDGTWAALCFPSFPGFGGGVFQRAKDKDLALMCVQAWNDWHIDEWCGSHPDRLIPLAILPVWDVELAAKEAERVAAKGCRTVSFPDSPIPLGLPGFTDDHWAPLWNVLEETEMPLSLHFGSGGFVPGFPFTTRTGTVGRSYDGPGAMGVTGIVGFKNDTPFAVAISLFATNLMWSTSELLFSGQLQKHPKLKVLLSEGGIGWIPYILERCDFTWEKHRFYQDIAMHDRPSDLFKKHFWGCFIDDEHGLKNRYDIGVDRLLLEIDYPHSDSNWPNSRKRAAEVLADIPDDARSVLRF